jgi:hypothetical protein
MFFFNSLRFSSSQEFEAEIRQRRQSCGLHFGSVGGNRHGLSSAQRRRLRSLECGS